MIVAINQEINTPQPSLLLLPRILLFLKKMPMPTTALIKIVIDENKPILAVVLLGLFSLFIHFVL
jgi:hypothetical protein